MNTTVTRPVTQPVTRPVTQPVTRPVTQPVTRPVTQPVTRPVTQPVTQPVTRPAIGTKIRPVAHTVEPILSSSSKEIEIRKQRFQQALKDGACDVVDSMLTQGFVPPVDSIETVCEEGHIDLLHKLLKYPTDVQKGLFSAITNKQFHLLDHLFLAGANVNLPDEHGDTVLHIVTDVKICQWLLDMGAKQVPNKAGQTPLHWACESHGVDIIKLLLTQPEGIESLTQRCSNGEPPLHWACDIFSGNENHKAGQILLSYPQGVETLSYKDNYGYTPLMEACESRNLELVRLFLTYDLAIETITWTDNDGRTCLFHACFGNNLPLVELLLTCDSAIETIALPDNTGTTCLHHACSKNNLALVELLLRYQQGIDTISKISQFGDTPLHAARLGDDELFETVLKHVTTLDCPEFEGVYSWYKWKTHILMNHLKPLTN